MHFFEKYVRIKIEDHEILFLMCERSRNWDKRNVRDLHKYKRIISYIKTRTYLCSLMEEPVTPLLLQLIAQQ